MEFEPDVAVLDEHAFAIADVGDAQHQILVLRNGDGGCEEGEQQGAKEEDSRLCEVSTIAIRTVRVHDEPPSSFRSGGRNLMVLR